MKENTDKTNNGRVVSVLQGKPSAFLAEIVPCVVQIHAYSIEITRCKMRGRPTNEPKQVNIKVRMTEEMKIYLEKSAEKCGMNISEYIRNMIAGDMRK